MSPASADSVTISTDRAAIFSFDFSGSDLGRGREKIRGRIADPEQWFLDDYRTSDGSPLRKHHTDRLHPARSRDGERLGEVAHRGPFIINGGTPCRELEPFLISGTQTLRFSEDLGFVGRTAVLETKATVRDVAGADWTASTSSSGEVLLPPILKSPVHTIVRQNDPQSGCAFDPVHGYGLVLDLSWDPPPGNIPSDIYYYVEVNDGAGRPLILNHGLPLIYSTQGTSTRIVECDVHVDSSGDHSASFGLASGSLGSFAVSGRAVASFDFESCRRAGTPACQ